MDLPEYDLSDAETSLSIFGCAPNLSSASTNWTDLHYERRRESAFHLPPHRTRGHWLIVRLNALSEAIRTAEGTTVHEYQHRGCTAYIPHGCSHRVVYPKGIGDRAIITLSPSLVDRVAEDLGYPRTPPLRPKFADTVDRLVEQVGRYIDEELRMENPNGAIFGDVAAHLIAVHLVRTYGSNGIKGKRHTDGTLAPRLLQRLIEYIDNRLDEGISLRDLATEARLSEFHLCRAFRTATGLPPHRFLIARRLERARRLLKDRHLSIQDVAMTVGFSDASQFALHFKKHFGVSPRAYRCDEYP